MKRAGPQQQENIVKTHPEITDECIGCYADAANGEEYRRIVLAHILCDTFGAADPRVESINRSLYHDPSDDYSDEQDALDLLQSVTVDGLVWSVENGGDLLLYAVDG